MEIDNSLVRNDEANEEKLVRLDLRVLKILLVKVMQKITLLYLQNQQRKEIQPWTMFCFMVLQD